MQVSGMSHSFTASRHVTPRSSYCQKAQTMWNADKTMKPINVKGLRGLCHIISEKTHLAVPAAQAVAAHGIVGKSTLLTAVGSTACTLLPLTEEWL